MTSKNLSMQEEIKSCYIFLDTGDTPQVVAQYALKDSIYNFIYGKSYLVSKKERLQVHINHA